MPTESRRPRALGYFSLGLGLTQVLVPGAVSRLIGLKSGTTSTTLMRAVGVRELAAGAGILSQSRPGLWLWSRVAGDIMDVALLCAALADSRNARSRLAAALSSVGAVTAADVSAAQGFYKNSTHGGAAEPGVRDEAQFETGLAERPQPFANLARNISPLPTDQGIVQVEQDRFDPHTP